MRHALIVLSLLVSGSFAQDRGQTVVETEIRHLMDQERQAFLRADTQDLARYFADEFVVTNPFNRFLHKQQVLEMVRNGTLAFSSFEREVEYVRQYGADTVIVAGEERGVWAGNLPTAGQPLHLRFTVVFRKQNGRWQQVARHASIVANQPPGGQHIH
jgi:uncharacterized protein (TIGR02246 family)